MRFAPRVRQPGGAMVAGWAAQGLIRSIQRNTISWASAASGSVAIDPVSFNDSLIRFLGYTNSGVDQMDHIPRIELTSGSLVTAYRYSTSANATTAAFEVIEFWPGVLRSVTRGTVAISASPQNLAIATLADMRRATLDLLGWRLNTVSSPVSYHWMTGQITSTTNAQFTSGSASGQEVGYQIAEWL
jgi:hypothetical protein